MLDEEGGYVENTHTTSVSEYVRGVPAEPLGPSLVDKIRELSAQPQIDYREALNKCAAWMAAAEGVMAEQQQRIAELDGLVTALLHDGEP